MVIKKEAKEVKKATKKMTIEELSIDLSAKIKGIEEKIDTWIARSEVLERKISEERETRGNVHTRVEKKYSGKKDDYSSDRKLYKVVCDECKQNCEVPFIPRGDWPVYCKTCNTRKKEANKFSKPSNRNERSSRVFNAGKSDRSISHRGKSSNPHKGKPKNRKAK
jgi:CxxC-x17-CxxC domain-containing protein